MSIPKIVFGSLAVCLVAFVAITTFMESRAPAGVAYDPLLDAPLNCSKFFDLLKTRYVTKTLLTSYSTLSSSAPNSVLVIIGPTEPFTSADERALESFVNGGGMLILIADNDGTGSELQLSLKSDSYYPGFQYGSPMISPLPLRDLESFEKRPDFVLLMNFASHPMVENVPSILTNYPTVITTGTTWSTSNNRVSGDIAWTTSRSFLDQDGDGIRDTGEPTGPFSVIAVSQAAGGGQLVLIADPGIFVNDMIDRANNRQFAMSLFNWATDNGSKPVVFDLTHGGYAPASWLTATPYGSVIFPTLAILFFSALMVAMGIAWGQKIELLLPRKIRGRFSRSMIRYQRRMKSISKTNLNEPLMVYYEQFLEKCVGKFRLKEKEETTILKRIKAEYPKYYKQLGGTINVCGQVRVGARDIRSSDTFKRIIKKLSTFEKELGVKA